MPDQKGRTASPIDPVTLTLLLDDSRFRAGMAKAVKAINRLVTEHGPLIQKLARRQRVRDRRRQQALRQRDRRAARRARRNR